jgi:hypothetical protein
LPGRAGDVERTAQLGDEFAHAGQAPVAAAPRAQDRVFDAAMLV